MISCLSKHNVKKETVETEEADKTISPGPPVSEYFLNMHRGETDMTKIVMPSHIQNKTNQIKLD